MGFKMCAFIINGITDELNCSTEDEIITEKLDDVFKRRRSSLYVLPSIDRLVLRTAQSIDGCWIGGGAVLSLFTGDLKIKDWDLFFKSHSHLKQAKEIFNNIGFIETSNSEWSITLTKADVDVQLITRFYYNKFEDIFKKFDFSVCCFVIDKDNVCYTSKAKEDVENKQMSFIYTENIATCIKRIASYGKKGYVPTDEFVEKIYDVFQKTSKKDIKKIRKKGSPSKS